MSNWLFHPGIRKSDDLTLGERAADKMRNGFGSWSFIGATLLFIALWITGVESGIPVDNKQLTILNLVLSCFAAMQGAIILLAAKRSDKISSELAQHDYEADIASRELLTELRSSFSRMQEQHAMQGQQLSDLHNLLMSGKVE